MRAYQTIFLLVAVLVGAVGCSSKENAVPVQYDGPLTEADDVEMLYTEKDMIKVKLDAKKVNELQNGDREFPEGIYLEFYDETGKIKSTLKANNAYYFKQEDKWRGRGNVEVKNIEKNQELDTEELFWTPNNKQIYSQKFVIIKLENEVIKGTGLKAREDLSDYHIDHPEGEFNVEE